MNHRAIARTAVACAVLVLTLTPHALGQSYWCWDDGTCTGLPTTSETGGGVLVHDCRYCVPPGEDCWVTMCGEGTQYNFCENPIPAGFFDLGSEEFRGIVSVHGLSGADTTVQRSETMAPEQGVTQVSVSWLELASCAPIMVEGSGAWDVTVDLSEVEPSEGSMTVTKTHENGGTYSAEFYVQPRFTFTRVTAPNDQRVLDCGLEGMEPMQFETVGPAPWTHDEPDDWDNNVCHGENFVAGAEGEPAKLRQFGRQAPCCRPVGHRAVGRDPDTGERYPPGHIHVTRYICTPCPGGACCIGDGSCVMMVGEDPEQMCFDADGVQFKGLGTTCADSDGDGLADVVETADCTECADRDPCNTGTDPMNPDTDGDGVEDGRELLGGSDPCDDSSEPIPTVSEWGLIVLTLLLLTAGTVVLGRRRRAAA